MCAALSSYAHACAAKGIVLKGWRDNACSEFSISPLIKEKFSVETDTKYKYVLSRYRYRLGRWLCLTLLGTDLNWAKDKSLSQ